jgi:hypothetical protein
VTAGPSVGKIDLSCISDVFKKRQFFFTSFVDKMNSALGACIVLTFEKYSFR